MDPSPHPHYHHHHHHHHHHRLHLHLDPRHHHHINIRLCHHLHGTRPPAPVPPPPPIQHRHPTAAAPWQKAAETLHAAGPNDRPQVEASSELEHPALHLEQGGEEMLVGEEEEEEEEPVFVLTYEWAEFFAKSEAKRALAKQQQKKKGRNM
ncbi:hypothetical protein GUJ93_ZPchr0001g31622 [Zizania palustris]|uniref:Uncharacterized protein n=1 Tax=Zizania palustris TaxID=103762 RepID=A0A8J5VBX0_ZIZPA|nr:hypothetical protein GUJ93_ZPchr0001g31622 [Zizania palustris]